MLLIFLYLVLAQGDFCNLVASKVILDILVVFCELFYCNFFSAITTPFYKYDAILWAETAARLVDFSHFYLFDVYLEIT